LTQSQNKIYGRRETVIVLLLVTLRGAKISSHAQKTGSWYLYGLVPKFQTITPVFLISGVSPRYASHLSATDTADNSEFA